MKLLVTGRGASGSFKIRGEQLGAAIGADVIPNASNLKGYDLAIIVKRPRADQLERIRQRGVPLVLDIVDAWPQPEGNEWDEKQCHRWLANEIANTRPQALVAATAAMATDCGRFGLPVLHLPHHARPGLQRNPVRASVRTVGYEGGPQYIERWSRVVEPQCRRRGWGFVVNPPSLAALDIVLALRDQTGYAPRHWKSAVKLANAQGSGTPCVLGRESGYTEQLNGTAFWADNETELAAMFDALEPWPARKRFADELYAGTPHLAQIAERYRAWLEALSF